ncbi:MAG: glycosyltransferase [Candidatus Glassbacteria bacterium]|nr:glycosyltransferase [Candidatus Glassbacteria bacterium]
MTLKAEKPGAGRSLRILLLAAADVVHARRWADYFRGRGHDVLLATLDPSGIEGFEEKPLASFTGINALRYPLAALSLWPLVRSFRPQVVNAHFVPGYGFLASLVPSARPLVVSTWGSDVLIGARRGFLHWWRARFVLRRAALVTCDGKVLVRALEELGVETARILNVPMGVEPGLFHPPHSASSPAGPRRKSGKRAFRLVSLRRLEPLYDVATLLRAAALLREAGWNFECLVVGDGSQRAELENLGKELFLENRVTFTGTLTRGEIADTLRQADIYVSCSRSDSTSVSLLEALATGLFPVVTDIPGNREWVEHGRNGLVFAPGDPGRLAEILIQAMQDQELRQGAYDENTQMARQKASWENNMKIVEENLLRIAAERG